MAENYFMGLDGFVWFTGVVEDRNDPAKLGRVRVRCLGIHTEDKNEIPTEDLPWAHIMHPVNDPSMQGMGMTPSFLVEGTWVVGWFRDAVERQQPIIMGTLPGYPQVPDDLNDSDFELDDIYTDPYAENRFKARGAGSLQYAEKIKQYRENRADLGFNDPNFKYPQYPNEKSGHDLGESDVNRLSRNDEDYQHRMLKHKKEMLEKFSYVGTASGQDWGVPNYNVLEERKTEYPFNHVLETESGHIREYDDTPEHERIHEYHTTGTYYEVDGGGNRVVHVVGDGYHLIAGSDYVNVKGHANLTVDGHCNTLVKGDYNIKVEGDMNVEVEQDFNTTVFGDTRQLYESKLITTALGAVSSVYNDTFDSVIIGEVTDTYDSKISRSVKGAVTERFGSTIDRRIDGIQSEIFASTVNLTTEGSFNIDSEISFNVNAVTVDLDGTTVDIDGTTTNINANTISVNAPSSNLLAKDSALGTFNGQIIHGTSGPSVETPDTPESELIITDITKGIEDGKNIVEEDELVDSQGPDRTEEAGTGDYLINTDGDYPFPILLEREDNPIGALSEKLGINENEYDLSEGAAKQLSEDIDLEKEAPDPDDPTGKKKVEVSDPDTLDFLEIGGVDVDDPSVFTPSPEATEEEKEKSPGEFFSDGKRKVVFEDEADKEGLSSKIIEIAENMADDLGYQMVVVRRGGAGARRSRSYKQAKSSQHLVGRALDIKMENKTVEERNKFIRTAVKYGVLGVGLYFPAVDSGNNFIHIDIKQGKLGKRTWKASGGWNTQYKWARATLQQLGYYV